jgi:hypothetical protein
VEHKDRSAKYVTKNSKGSKLESIDEEDQVFEAILDMVLEKRDSVHSDTPNN